MYRPVGCSGPRIAARSSGDFMGYTPHYDYPSRLLLLKLMNKPTLRDLPRLSNSDVHLTRSFFHIEFLSPRAKARAKIIALRATPSLPGTSNRTLLSMTTLDLSSR
jgi:hypothetical protein